jgi:signal transduction histidine kinase
VQELVGLDILLATMRNALANGDLKRAEELLAEAREISQRNVTTLREEMINLGPYAFDELSVDTALEQCIPVWSRRYGFEVEPSLERLDLSNEVCGALFGIAQEAVANAGRHAQARHVWVTLRRHGDEVELRVRDDGRGFDGEQPLGVGEAGHIGLASMRERAELIDGSLAIETGPEGSEIVVRAPIASRGGEGRLDERPGIALSGR